MNFMKVVKKNAEGCILEYARAGFIWGLAISWNTKEWVFLRLLSGAQDSDKV